MIREKSAGAIVFIRQKEILYLLLHYEEGHWDFPKGHIEKGETEIDTSRREIKEETGITDTKLTPNFKEDMHYFYKVDKRLISKNVVFYLAETKTKQIKLSFEHIGYEWLPYDKAMEGLTYKNSREILKKANEFLKKNKTLQDF